MDKMDSHKFPEDDVDGSEGEEETDELQPDFSAQEVEVEEVTVMETEEIIEVVEVLVTEETAIVQQDDDFPEPGRNEGRSIPEAIELDKTGEGANLTLVTESETARHAPNEDTTSNQECVDDSRNVNEAATVATVEALDDSLEEATMLQRSESGQEEALDSPQVVSSHSEEGLNGDNEKAKEGDDQQTPSELEKVEATGSADCSGLDGALPVKESAAIKDTDLEHKQAPANGEVADVDGNYSVVQDHDVGAAQGNRIVVNGNASSMEGGELNRDGINLGGNEKVKPSSVSKLVAQIPGSESKIPLGSGQPSDDAELGSASTSVPLFNDAMQAQLGAQILVMGALRKGTKPHQVLVESACPGSSKGAAVAGASSSALHPEGNEAANGVSTARGISSLPSSATPSDLPSASQRSERTLQPSLGLTEAPRATEAMGNETGAAEEPALAEPSSKKKRKSNRNESQQTDSVISGHLVTNTMAVRPNASQAIQDQLHDDTDKQLQLAQSSAQEAMTTATSALAQSHMAWARIQSQNPSQLGTRREAQIASVAATVAAAASVAKAAVEAAKALADVSIEAFMEAGAYQRGAGGARTPHLRSSHDTPQIANGSHSAPRGKTRFNAATHLRVNMLDSVVRAAGMAAEAATQAGAVLTMANPLMQSSGMEGFWARRADAVEEVDERAKGVGSKKGRASKGKGVEGTTSVNGTPKRQKSHVGASPATASAKKTKDASPKKKNPKRGKEVADGKTRGMRQNAMKQKESSEAVMTLKNAMPQPDLREPRIDRNTKDNSETIVEGSAVEVMSDEEGLRGGWFSGKVLKVNEKEAFVVYDELLTDDGTSNLKEWFPFKDVHGDRTGSRRQVRPVHPYTFVREAGSKKRRRVALGSQTWTVGDHVDAFIQDGWWEGVVVEINDLDESKATVYFPGENDTQVVKAWDLRPSLLWTDNKWMPWTDSSVTEDERPEKRQKVGRSSTKKKGGSSSTAKDDKAEELNLPESSGKARRAKPEKRSLQELNGKATEAQPEKKNLPESSGKAMRATPGKRNVPEPSGEIVESSPRRATRHSTDGKKQEIKPAPEKSSQKKSGNKKAGKTGSEAEAAKTPRGAHQEDGIPTGTPKKLNFGGGTVTPSKSGKKSERLEASRTPTTRGKLRAEGEETRRPTRQKPTSKVGIPLR